MKFTDDKAIYIDVFTALSLFLFCYIFYFFWAIELYHVGFYEQMNIAFDLDQSIYFNHLTSANIELFFPIKHPFIHLYAGLNNGLNYLGMPLDIAVIAQSLFFQAGSLFITFFIFRFANYERFDAFIVSLGLMGTSTYISTGLVFDVYSISVFWISLIFLFVTAFCYQQYITPSWVRAIVSILAIGTTTYLIMLVVLMELLLSKNKEDGYLQVLFKVDIYKQASKVLVLGILIFICIYHEMLMEILSNPVGLARRTFWTINRPGEKAGLLQIFNVFALYSIIAPSASIIPLPEGGNMIDLRGFNVGFIGGVFLVILAVSVGVKLKSKEQRKLLFFSLLWLVINLIFHGVYQYRGSLFLYTGHFVLAVWILFTFKPLQLFYKPLYGRLLLCLMTVLIWSNNSVLIIEIFVIS